MNLDELIERVEADSGPARELDLCIKSAIYGGEARMSPFNGEWCLYVVGADKLVERPRSISHAAWSSDRYSASLDAVRTLIDPADEWQLSTIYNIARAEVGINRDHQTAWPGHGEHKGADPVRALLAAALRARKDAQ